MRHVRCRACAADRPFDDRFCGTCGATLDRSPAADVGKRRPLTVAFCELVGSTDLAASNDPADVRDVFRLYQSAASDALVAAGGTIVRVMGDGILAYFGYPVDSDDAAHRAIDGCLGAVDAVRALDTHLTRRLALRLSCRAGVHTGTVYVGPIRDEGRSESDDVVGDLPNVAARLQAAADPHQVLIGDSTQSLVAGWFETRRLGPRMLRGLGELDVHLVVERTQARTRLDVHRQRGFATFVGRGEQLTAMRALSRVATAGSSVAIHVVGPVGVGKSRLVAEVLLAATPAVLVPCDPLTASTPLGAFAPALSRAGLHPEHEPERHRSRWFARLADLLVTAAGSESSPLVVLAEDIHWADPSTMQLLEAIHDHQRPTVTLLTERSPAPRRAWTVVTELAGLSPAEADQLADNVGGHDPTTRELVQGCDGIPLFIQEMLRLRLLGETDAMPSTMRGLLAARLDAVGDARRVAQAGSVVGRVFTEDDVRTLIPTTIGLARHLATLEATDVIERDGAAGRWRFCHALHRDTAYESIPRDDRTALHGSLADHRASSDDARPETIAVHLEAAGRFAEAVDTWEAAGHRAGRAWFHAESTSHFERALSCVARLPAGETRDEIELRIRSHHAQSLQSHRDHTDPELTMVLVRCEEMARRHGGRHVLTFTFPLASNAQALADYARCERILLEGRVAATTMGLVDTVSMIDQVRGSTRGWRGDLIGARTLIDPALAAIGLGLGAPATDGMAASDPRLPVAASTLGVAALIATLRGEHDEAAARIDQGRGITAAPESMEARSMLWMLASMCHQLRDDRDETAAAARQSIDAARDLGGAQSTAWAAVLLAWAEQSLDDLNAALTTVGTANRNIRPYMLALRADTLARRDPDAALAALTDAFGLVEQTGGRFCEPLLHRVTASVRRDLGDLDGAEDAERRLAERATAQGAALYATASGFHP